MFDTCVLTVRSDTPSSKAIALFACPRASCASTSSSRGVSCGPAARSPPAPFAPSSAASCSTSIVATAGASSASPECTVRIAATSSGGWTSLSRYPAAPARTAGSTVRSSAKLVSTRIRVAGQRARICLIASMPSSRGMTRSSRTTSGSVRATSSTASAPSAASPTTSTSSWSSRNVRRPWRTTAWSSASATRIVTRACARSRRRQWSIYDALSSLACVQPHARPHVGRRVDAQGAAERAGALLHRRQAEPPSAHLGRRRVEADAVVDHLEGEPAVAGVEGHVDPGGVRVAQRVVQRLLGDAEDVAVARPAGPRRARDLQGDVLRVDAAQDADVLAQRRGEPLVGERRRAQLVDQRAQLLHAGASELADPVELHPRGGRVAVHQGGRRLGGEDDPEQVLRHGVVQLAGHAVALLDDRELAAALVQARVLDRDRGVGGEHL